MAQPDRSPEIYGFRFRFPAETPDRQIKTDVQTVIDSRFSGIKLRPNDLSVGLNGLVNAWGKGVEVPQGSYGDNNMTQEEKHARILAVNIMQNGDSDFVVSERPRYFSLVSEVNQIFPHQFSEADQGTQARIAEDTITQIKATGTAPFYGRVIEEWERLDAQEQSGEIELSSYEEIKLRMDRQILISNFGEKGIIPVFQAWNHPSAAIKRATREPQASASQ